MKKIADFCVNLGLRIGDTTARKTCDLTATQSGGVAALAAKYLSNDLLHTGRLIALCAHSGDDQITYRFVG